MEEEEGDDEVEVGASPHLVPPLWMRAAAEEMAAGTEANGRCRVAWRVRAHALLTGPPETLEASLARSLPSCPCTRAHLPRSPSCTPWCFTASHNSISRNPVVQLSHQLCGRVVRC